MGSCILQLQDEKFPIRVVGWRGSCSLRAYIAVPDGIHYLRILGEDVSMFGKKFIKSLIWSTFNHSIRKYLT